VPPNFSAGAKSCFLRSTATIQATIFLATVAGNGNYSASGDGGPATSAGLQWPDSLALDTAGSIYIASTNGAKIRKVTAATGQINSIAGIKDLRGDIGDGGLATAAEVAPRALALDANGNLYISNDAGEIRKIDAATGIISRVAGIGFPGYSGDGVAATAAEISYPNQIAFDPTGNLYFADAMGRIRKVILVSQPAATPTLTPAAGTYASGQRVTISDTTAGATIYYTLDGTTPTTASTTYTGPITLTSSGSINAIAVAVGYTQSAIASANYSILPSAAPPSFNPAAGTYISVQMVTISDATTGATIHYTTDGSTPTSTSPVFAVPLAVNASETIQAIAVASGYSQSGVASATYTINLPPPTFTISSASVTVTKGATTGNASTLTVQPSNGFTGSVTLTALLTSSPGGAQYLPTLSFGTTSPVTITGTTAGAATLTITTTAATSAANREGTSLWISGSGFTLALTVFFCIPARRRNWKTLTLSLAVLLVLSSFGACGGGSGNSRGGTGGGGGIAGTTSGDYVITITGTSGSLTQTGVVNLTVR
jgi:hypothetical protein